jgi:regulatory protein
MDQIAYDQALSKAMALCSKAEKCSFDIRKKLEEWRVAPQDIPRMIKRLIDDRFVDDERYARFFVRDKFRFNHWGKIKIGYMLRGKQFSEELIFQAFSEIDEYTYVETLIKILRDKTKNTKFVNEYDRKAKLVRFAQSRGFEFEAIEKALTQL